MNLYLNKVVDVIDQHIKVTHPKMKWMWGEALFGYALLLLDEYLGDTKYKKFIEDYLDYYLENTPIVDQSDTFAPVLISHTYQRIYQNKKYESLTQKGLDYFNSAHHVIDFLPNHLGHSFIGKFYPKSIWVDSIMMYGVFLSIYGKYTNDSHYINLSYQTVMKFNEYLGADGLWRHSFWTKKKKAYPKNLYWGRGNGWVVTALPMILDNLPDLYKKDIKPIYINTVESIIKYQNQGLYHTLLNKKSILESSASFLINGGILHGAVQGLVSIEIANIAKTGYENSINKFVILKKEKLVLSQVSNPTIPLHVFPTIGYKYIGVKDNWSYGLASLIFSSIHYDQYLKSQYNKNE